MLLPTFSVGIRKIGIAIAGFGVLVCGLALLVVPIPGTSFVVFPLGLAILAKEFEWARRMLGWSQRTAHSLWAGVRRRCAPVTPAPAQA